MKSILKAGSILDGYKIIRFLGNGGFGEVWLCQSETMGDYRALKMIPSADTERLDREFNALTYYRKAILRINSPHLLTIEHVNKNKDGLYYVMPLADGVIEGNELNSEISDPRSLNWKPLSLQTLMESKLNSPQWFNSNEIKSIIIAVLDGLQLLTENSLVHRDVKPENILFFNGEPCLADISLIGEDSAQLTRRGTPGYSTPTWYVGGFPDMYGAAALLYTLLTSNSPDKLGRSAFQWPPQGESNLSISEQVEWRKMHQVIRRATDEQVSERFIDFRSMSNAINSESLTNTSSHPSLNSSKKKILISFIVLIFLTASIYFFTFHEFDNNSQDIPVNSNPTNEISTEKTKPKKNVPTKPASDLSSMTKEEINDYRIKAAMIEGYMVDRKYELALSTIDSLYYTYPRSMKEPAYSTIRAMALIGLGKNNEAKEELKKEVNITPQIAAMTERKRLWEALGDLAGAENDLTRVIMKYGNGSFILFLRADIRCQRGDFKGALNDRKAAMKLHPEEIEHNILIDKMWQPLAKKYPELNKLIVESIKEQSQSAKPIKTTHDEVWVLEVFDIILSDLVNPARTLGYSKSAMNGRKHVAKMLHSYYTKKDYSSAFKLLNQVLYSSPALRKSPPISLFRALLQKHLGTLKIPSEELVKIIHQNDEPRLIEARIALLSALGKKEQAKNLIQRVISKQQTLLESNNKTGIKKKPSLDLVKYKELMLKKRAINLSLIKLHLLNARVNFALSENKLADQDIVSARGIANHLIPISDRMPEQEKIHTFKKKMHQLYLNE